MSTDLDIVLGHNLDETQVANLPTLLNQYFSRFANQIQVRVGHGYTGTVVETEDGDWDWQGSDRDDWELQLGKLEDENPWNWAWNSEQEVSFEHWFQKQQSYGYVHLIGCYGMSLFISSKAVMLITGIRWDHFVFDPIVQNDMRQFTKYFAEFLCVDSAIYVPGGVPPASDIVNDCVDKGWSFEQICLACSAKNLQQNLSEKC